MDKQLHPAFPGGIKKLAKKKSGLFKKADQDQLKNVLFSSTPSSSDMTSRSIIKFLEYCRQHLEDNNEEEAFNLLLGLKNHDDREVAIALDCFNNIKGLRLETEFSLEMDKNINFDDLYFLSFNTKAKIFQSQTVTIPNVMVYKKDLIFGELHLYFPDKNNMDQENIIMKKCFGNIEEVKRCLEL